MIHVLVILTHIGELPQQVLHQDIAATIQKPRLIVSQAIPHRTIYVLMKVCLDGRNTFCALKQATIAQIAVILLFHQEVAIIEWTLA